MIVTLAKLFSNTKGLPLGLLPSKRGAIRPTSTESTLCSSLFFTDLPDLVFLILSPRESKRFFASSIGITLLDMKRSRIKIDSSEFGDAFKKSSSYS